MIKFQGLGHISLNVEDVDVAAEYYCDLFGAKKLQKFPHFKNLGCAKSAGFLNKPEVVNVSIVFLEIPGTPVNLELCCYHSPLGLQEIKHYKTNDLGGPRHICLRVADIDKAFDSLKGKEVTFINQSPEYKAFKIDEIKPSEFYFYDESLENNTEEKQKVCDIIGNIRYFYFIDKYGIQWEFEQGHDDIGSEH
ncbi:MAG: VOC family protein [Pseudomonadota bacterium]